MPGVMAPSMPSRHHGYEAGAKQGNLRGHAQPGSRHFSGLGQREYTVEAVKCLKRPLNGVSLDSQYNRASH